MTVHILTNIRSSFTRDNTKTLIYLQGIYPKQKITTFDSCSHYKVTANLQLPGKSLNKGKVIIPHEYIVI